MKMLRLIPVLFVLACVTACSTTPTGNPVFAGIPVFREDDEPRGPPPDQRRCTYGATRLTNATNSTVEFVIGVPQGMSAVRRELVVSVPAQTVFTPDDFPDGQPAQMRMRPGEVAAVVVIPEGGVPSLPTIIRRMPQDCSDRIAVNFLFEVRAERRGSSTYAIVQSGVP